MSHHNLWGDLIRYVAVGSEVLAVHINSLINKLNADDVSIVTAVGDIPYGAGENVGQVLSFTGSSVGDILVSGGTDGDSLVWQEVDLVEDLVSVSQFVEYLDVDNQQDTSVSDIYFIGEGLTATLMVLVNNPNSEMLTVKCRHTAIEGTSYSINLPNVVGSGEVFVFNTIFDSLGSFGVQADLDSNIFGSSTSVRRRFQI